MQLTDVNESGNGKKFVEKLFCFYTYTIIFHPKNNGEDFIIITS